MAQKQQQINIEFKKMAKSKEKRYYQLANQILYPQGIDCRAIACNQNFNLILLTIENKVHVFQFKKEALKLVQIISQNQKAVTTLNFSKYNPLFFFGSSDCSITVNSQNLIKNAKYIIKLKGHLAGVNCSILHPKENLLISGSDDFTIKFWNSTIQEWSYQQTIDQHKDSVRGLSINENGNQLISSGDDKQILVIEYSKDNIWKVKQMIEMFSYRILFISNESFIILPYLSNTFELYSLNQDGLFIKQNGFPIKNEGKYCSCFCPAVYIPEKNWLFLKNGINLSIFQFDFQSENNQFFQNCKINQTINLGHHKFCGTVSQNGEYLITWNARASQLDIRKINKQKI
ncbi:unnamed protein product [Paramecium sonneborni]|uniref:Uncharacterized protein n=1 Tax=Paramecium sonneborni TaxID=65129 RepID=A0A8S1NN27_9CILI|nr:unnamed protein product [Paramecium sonneborni]